MDGGTVASGIGFYERTEIVALRNLFQVLADPSDDLALYSLLRSPLFGFEDSRVVSLWTTIDRNQLGDGELWAALDASDDEQLTTAHNHLTRWRQLAGLGGTEAVVETWDALLERIIEDTGKQREFDWTSEELDIEEEKLNDAIYVELWSEEC